MTLKALQTRIISNTTEESAVTAGEEFVNGAAVVKQGTVCCKLSPSCVLIPLQDFFDKPRSLQCFTLVTAELFQRFLQR